MREESTKSERKTRPWGWTWKHLQGFSEDRKSDGQMQELCYSNKTLRPVQAFASSSEDNDGQRCTSSYGAHRLFAVVPCCSQFFCVFLVWKTFTDSWGQVGPGARVQDAWSEKYCLLPLKYFQMTLLCYALLLSLHGCAAEHIVLLSLFTLITHSSPQSLSLSLSPAGGNYQKRNDWRDTMPSPRLLATIRFGLASPRKQLDDFWGSQKDLEAPSLLAAVVHQGWSFKMF